MRPCALQSSSAGPRGIGRNGSQAAKSDFALPGAGSSAGDGWARVERTKASAKDIGGDAGAREPGVVHQQQRKGRAHRPLRDASATGYICAEGKRSRRADREEGTSAAGIGCQGRGGTTGGSEGKTPEGGGRSTSSKSRRKLRRSATSCKRTTTYCSG